MVQDSLEYRYTLHPEVRPVEPAKVEEPDEQVQFGASANLGKNRAWPKSANLIVDFS